MTFWTLLQVYLYYCKYKKCWYCKGFMLYNKNSTRMRLFALLEQCLMLKMLLKTCVYPAFFFFLASDHNQKSVVVRKACKNRLFGTFWWSARHFTEIFHRFIENRSFCPVRCADHVKPVYLYIRWWLMTHGYSVCGKQQHLWPHAAAHKPATSSALCSSFQ